jgi:DHA2 family multidrug resistance protein
MNGSPLTGFRLFFATVAISVGTLLITLDQFIVNVALPTIAGELGVSVDDATWVVTSYVVANAITVPLTGWLASRIGRIKLFSFSAIAFAVVSFLCGLSLSFPMLIAFRVLQGLVSGSLIPLSQALLLYLFPNKKGFATGIWGLVIMVGPAMGPVLGGWIINSYSWSWLFWINLPLGILAGSVTYSIMHPLESKREKRVVDTVGIILLVLWVGTYQVMLDRGNDLDWFNSNFIRTLTIIALITFCFFLIWEVFHPDPVVDLSLFKKWNFTLGSLLIGGSMLIVFGSLIVSPNWVQETLGYTPLWAGFSIAPFGASAFFIFPLVGLYIHLMPTRLWIIIGYLFLIPSFFYMAYLTIDTPFSKLAWPRFFQGIGFAFFYVPLTTISLAGISEKQLPSAAGVFSFARLLFISAGVSLNTTYFSRRENFFQSRYAELVIPANPQWQIYTADVQSQLGLTGEHANALIYNMVVNQAQTETFLEMCYLWGLGFVVLFALLFFLKGDRKGAKGLT